MTAVAKGEDDPWSAWQNDRVAVKEEKSWSRGGGDWKSENRDSKSWGNSSWSGGQQAKTDSWRGSTKQQDAWDNKSWGSQKRSWEDASSGGDVKKGRWREETDVKTEIKQEVDSSWTPQEPAVASSWTPVEAPQMSSGSAEQPFIPTFRGAPTTPPPLRTAATTQGAMMYGQVVPQPSTPAWALSRGSQAPQQRAPGTPTRMPGTPTRGVPGEVPGTPSGLATPRHAAPAPGTPQFAGGVVAPSTPHGLLGSQPFTPAGLQGASMRQASFGSTALGGAAMTPAAILNNPVQNQINVAASMTPAAIFQGLRGAPATPGAIVPAVFSDALVPASQKATIFSDGADAALRHAPRRKHTTDVRVPAPSAPAALPQHWMKKDLIVAGKKEKPKVVADPIPNFDAWRKNRRKDKAKIVSVRPAPGVYSPLVPDQALPKFEEMTPAPAGDMTPAMPGYGDGETPALPPGETPRMPGVETPGQFGAETPFPGMDGGETPGGGATPRVPYTPADGLMLAKGEATPVMGGETPRVVPTCPPRPYFQNKIKESETPLDANGAVTPMDGGETPGGPPHTPADGETPRMEYMPGMDTPMLPPMRAAPGMETPLMPPAHTGPHPGSTGGLVTPPPGGLAASTMELTPGLDGQRPNDRSNEQAAPLKSASLSL